MKTIGLITGDWSHKMEFLDIFFAVSCVWLLLLTVQSCTPPYKYFHYQQLTYCRMIPLLIWKLCILQQFNCYYDVFTAYFSRYPYLIKKKKYFRNWWMKTFHSWELHGLLRWPMLITLHCLKRRRQRSGKHLILSSASICLPYVNYKLVLWHCMY